MSDTMISLWVRAKHAETWHNTKIASNATAARVYSLLEGDFASRAKTLAELAFLPFREGFFISDQSVFKRTPAQHLMRGGDHQDQLNQRSSSIRSKLKDQPAKGTA
jgi:hypothetical protein